MDRIGLLWAAFMRRLDGIQQRHTVLGFPLAVIKKYGDDRGGKHAALITYYAFLSAFPIVLLAVVIATRALAYDPDLRTRVIEAIVPAEFTATVESGLLSLPTGGLPLVIGALGLVLTGLGVVFSVYDTLNDLAGVPFRDRHNMLGRYLRALVILLLLLVTVFGIGALTIFESDLATVALFVRVGTVLGVLGLTSILIVVTVKLAVAKPAPIRSYLGASVTSALAVTAVVLIFSPLLARFVARSGAVYGTFATIAGLFALLYIVSQIFLYAGEASVVRRRHLWPRALDATKPTTADRRAWQLEVRTYERVPGQRVRVTGPPPPKHSGDAPS